MATTNRAIYTVRRTINDIWQSIFKPNGPTDGKLKVEADLVVGDIEIGAVEIKNDDTDDRAKVINTTPAGTEYGLVVRPANLPPGAATEITLASILSTLGTGVVVTATDLDIRNLVFATDKVDVSGSSVAASVSGEVSITSGSGFEAETSKIDLDDLGTSVTALSTRSFLHVYDDAGSNWDRLRGTSADGVLVNLGTNNDVTVTGTVIVDTELPTPVVLGDLLTNPTVPQVGGHVLLWDAALGLTWFRARGLLSTGMFVDVRNVIPGTAATNLGKAIDSVVGATDTGVGALHVRNDDEAFVAGTDLDYALASVDSKGNTRIVGNRNHDAVDSGSPLKIGGKATALEPGAVATGDRVDADFDRRGKLGVFLAGSRNNDGISLSSTSEAALKTGPAKSATADLQNINTTYDDSPTSANSEDVDCTGFREFSLSFTLQSANTPTNIQFIVQFKDADGNYLDYQNDFWQFMMFEDQAVASAKSWTFNGGKISGFTTMRVRVVATGTDATNTFTVSEAKLTFTT